MISWQRLYLQREFLPPESDEREVLDAALERFMLKAPEKERIALTNFIVVLDLAIDLQKRKGKYIC